MPSAIALPMLSWPVTTSPLIAASIFSGTIGLPWLTRALAVAYAEKALAKSSRAPPRNDGRSTGPATCRQYAQVEPPRLSVASRHCGRSPSSAGRAEIQMLRTYACTTTSSVSPRTLARVNRLSASRNEPISTTSVGITRKNVTSSPNGTTPSRDVAVAASRRPRRPPREVPTTAGTARSRTAGAEAASDVTAASPEALGPVVLEEGRGLVALLLGEQHRGPRGLWQGAQGGLVDGAGLRHGVGAHRAGPAGE